MTKRDLYEHLRAQCCDISGLTKKQLDKHAMHVTETVIHARTRQNRTRAHHRQGKRAPVQTKGR